MISAQTIRKLAFFIAVASFVFTIVLAFAQFMLLDLTTVGAPATYYLYTVLIEVIPYLFVGVLALLVSVMWHDDEPQHIHEVSGPEPEATQTATT
jgi:hypothetical protein